MNSETSAKPVCWVVTEGMAGTENQCLGIAESLGLSPVIKRVKLRQPWKTFSPWLGFECAASFEEKLEGPWPDLVIASGRKSVAAARYIKKKNPDVFLAQVQDPRVNPKEFDLLAVPAHDPARGDNVIVTLATPNRVTDEKLAKAKTQFSYFEKIRSPRVAVLIGGKSKAYDLTPEITRDLGEKLKNLEGGLMITASRRTGEANRAILENALQETDAWLWDGSGENPYFGLLAWADFILVTADSASMISEAATTGKPVYIISLKGGAKRLDLMHKNMIEAGAVRWFEGKLEAWKYEPLRDAAKVAGEIKRRWKSAAG